MKRFVSRWLAAVRLVVIGLVSLLGATALAADAGPGALAPNPASTSPCLDYLPKDCWGVGELNWRAVVTFLNSPEMKQNPQHAQFEQAMQMVQIMTGIDGEKEVERITVFLTFDSRGEVAGAVAVQGSFNNLIVERRLRLMLDETARTERYNDHNVYTVNEVSFCLPGRSTILVGDEDALHRSLDQFEAAAAKLPEGLQQVLDRTPDDVLAWFAVCPPALLASEELSSWRREHPTAYRSLRQTEGISVAIAAGADGLRINALGYIPDPDDAKTVYRYLRDRQRDLLHKEGANILLASFLVLSELDQNDRYIQGSFALTLGSVLDLWETKFIVKP